MSITKGMMSSDQQDWSTPPEFMEAIGKEFDLDACAYDKTAKAPRWFTEEDDALTKDWNAGRVWMNPPYGRALPVWLQKAYEESRKDHCGEVWCLVPARPDTSWFHEIACKGQIVLLRGRISFHQDGKSVGSPAFPSMLVIFNKNKPKKITTWEWKPKTQE